MSSLFSNIDSNRQHPDNASPVCRGCRTHRLHLCWGVRLPQRSPVGWGSRIDWLHPCRGVSLLQWKSWYIIEQSDDEAAVMLEPWRMQCRPSLPSFLGTLCVGVVAPESPIYGSNRTVWHLNWVQINDLSWIILLEIELFDNSIACKQMADV